MQTARTALEALVARATLEPRGPVRDVLERFGCDYGKRKRNQPDEPSRSTTVLWKCKVTRGVGARTDLHTMQTRVAQD